MIPNDRAKLLRRDIETLTEHVRSYPRDSGVHTRVAIRRGVYVGVPPSVLSSRSSGSRNSALNSSNFRPPGWHGCLVIISTISAVAKGAFDSCYTIPEDLSDHYGVASELSSYVASLSVHRVCIRTVVKSSETQCLSLLSVVVVLVAGCGAPGGDVHAFTLGPSEHVTGQCSAKIELATLATRA